MLWWTTTTRRRSDDVMEHIDGAVRVSEIIELLRAEYGIVTGEFVCFCLILDKNFHQKIDIK